LKSLGIKNLKIVVYNDRSSDKDRKKILNLIQDGLTGGLISDSGTPLISDPGFKLSTGIINEGINLVPLPGATSITTALIGSGLPTDRFQFLGFFPRKRVNQHLLLEKIADYDGSSILFESPKRLISTLEKLKENLSVQAKICVAKELTKIHESFIRGSLADVLKHFDNNKDTLKGEFVLVIESNGNYFNTELVDFIFKQTKDKLSLKEISYIASKVTGISKNNLYERFLLLSKKN